MRLVPAAPIVLAVSLLCARASAWEVSSASGDYVARLAAANAVEGEHGSPARPELTFSCRSGGLWTTLSWPDTVPLNAGQRVVLVAWSFDDGSNVLPMRAAGGALAYGGSAAKTWLGLLARANRLQLQVPDSHGGQTASFDLDGTAAVQAGIARSACG
jgi:hypothetical protein